MKSFFSIFHAYRRGEISFFGMLVESLKAKADSKGGILSRIPLKTFFSHFSIFGTTGCGKSNIYELIVKRFLPQVIMGKMTMIIIDSSVFPNRVLRYIDVVLGKLNSSRIILIDPQPAKGKSTRHYIEANIFEMPASIRDQVSEDFVGSFYTEVCQTLFDQPLTEPMKTLLKRSGALMENTGKPSLPRLVKILANPAPFVCECDDEELADWFKSKVMVKNSVYKKTAEFVGTRLDVITSSSAMRRMLCSESPKVNLIEQVLNGCFLIVATRTAGGGGDEAARVLGRVALMVAGIASQAKAIVDGVPSLLICDEAHDYTVDEDIPSVRNSLKKDRKNSDGRCLASQQPDDFCKLMFNTMMNCAGMKACGRMENFADAKRMAPGLGVTPEEIVALKVGEFFIKVRGLHDKAIKVFIEPGALGKWKNEKQMNAMAAEARQSVDRFRAIQAARYGNDVSQKRKPRKNRRDEPRRLTHSAEPRMRVVGGR